MTNNAKAKSGWLLRGQLAGFAGSKKEATKSLQPPAVGAPSLMQSAPIAPAASAHDRGINGLVTGESVRISKVISSARTPSVSTDAHLPGLELVRGLACLQVFLSHIFIVLMLHSRVKMSPSYWKLAVLDWSYQSVMVFFVLSGYVIALSQQRKQQNFTAFMRSRFRRLEPLYLVALALSFGLEAFFYPPPVYDKLVGHLFYLQGSSFTSVFSTNTPLWSLSYEFFFYLIFACTIGRHQKPLQAAWFLLGLGAMVCRLAGLHAPGMLNYFQSILSMSPVWLLGTFLVQRPFYAGANLVQKLALFGMLPLATHSLPFLGAANSPAHSLLMGMLVAPLLFAVAQTHPVPSQSRPLVWGILLGLYGILAGSFLTTTQSAHNHTEILFDLLAPFGFLLLVPLYRLLFGGASFFTARMTRFSLALGKMSYAIYIIHFPLLILLGMFMVNPLLQVVADILLVFPLAWFLTYYLEPALRSVFDRLWPVSGKMSAGVDARYRMDVSRSL